MVKQLKNPLDFFNALKKLQQSSSAMEYRDEILFKDGRMFEFYTIPQIRDNDVIGHVFSFRDVTMRKEMEQQLIYQATHDTLTSLPNRVLLQDRIQQTLVFYRRTHQSASILFFDLDDFKPVNDKLGHDIGDILLQAVAKRLESCVRSQDTVARWGGDEFVALLTAVSDKSLLVPIVLKILEAMRKPFIIDKHRIKITISVGISILPQDGTTPATLLKNADIAMQTAKAEGKNNYAFYTTQLDTGNVPKLDVE
jgi:diguanylate cyclase (GGDEF)-like protein